MGNRLLKSLLLDLYTLLTFSAMSQIPMSLNVCREFLSRLSSLGNQLQQVPSRNSWPVLHRKKLVISRAEARGEIQGHRLPLLFLLLSVSTLWGQPLPMLRTGHTSKGHQLLWQKIGTISNECVSLLLCPNMFLEECQGVFLVALWYSVFILTWEQFRIHNVFPRDHTGR